MIRHTIVSDELQARAIHYFQFMTKTTYNGAYLWNKKPGKNYGE